MKIICWNVNGVRAAERKGFLDWLSKENPDVCCIQETKGHVEKFSEAILNPPGYEGNFAEAEKAGYSGVASFCKGGCEGAEKDFGGRFGTEGRVMQTDHGDFLLLNVYFPNGKAREERLKYKMDFYEEMLKYTKELIASGREVIVCGDFNTAHTEIDLARPKANKKISGFLPEERDWMDRFEVAGFTDIFRKRNPETPEIYTWWSMISGARQRNVGWRIDYFYITDGLIGKVVDATVEAGTLGSDHCPITIELK